MPYFLTESELLLNVPTEVTGDEFSHLKSAHRINIGEDVTLQDPSGHRFICKVSKIEKRSVVCIPYAKAKIPRDPKLAVSIFCAYINEPSLNLIIQKSTELGAHSISIFRSKRSQPLGALAVKLIRWNKIAREAAKQCGRQTPPGIEFVEDICKVLALDNKIKSIFGLELGGEHHDAQIHPLSSPSALIVGPEGGFDNEELRIFRQLPGYSPLTLGNFTLRSETAVIAGLSVLYALAKEF